MLSGEFFAALIERTERLGKWFLWGRRRLRDEVVASLHTVAVEAHQATQQLQAQQLELGQWEEHHTVLSKHKEVIAAQLLVVETKAAQASQELGTVRDSLGRLEESYAGLRERHDLVAGLLSVRAPVTPGLSRLRKLVDQDYMAFANDEQSLAEEAEALLLLQGVLEDLRLLSCFPAIYGKRRVAIAGSFSAGKSELVNSFIGDSSVRLAVGVEPVTAIPTYVVAAPTVTIHAYGASGGSLPLSAGMYKRISHDFIKSLGFDLKQVLPALSLGVPLDEDLFGNLCLVDTPGYNPSAGDGYTEQDRATARDFIASAKALLWVVGIDANGTLSASDLRFIRGLERGDLPLYVIVNKVDLRSTSEVDDILDEVEDVLADEEIAVAGISAYSAKRRQEFAWRGRPLADFLRSQNERYHAEDRILGTIDTVFNMYQCALKADLARCREIDLAFKSMHLDVLQHGSDALYVKLGDRFSTLRKHFDPTHLDELLQRAELLRTKLLEAVRQALDEVSVIETNTAT
jgi:GTPase SAR1 family protein